MKDKIDNVIIHDTLSLKWNVKYSNIVAHCKHVAIVHHIAYNGKPFKVNNLNKNISQADNSTISSFGLDSGSLLSLFAL
jgi:hypothetical protein